MFTLLVNATTMKKLLEKLGMSDISDAKKIAMGNAVRQIQESNQRTLTMLKADRFLADADWDIAERDCEMHNPYMHVEGEVRVFFDNSKEAHLHEVLKLKPLAIAAITVRGMKHWERDDMFNHSLLLHFCIGN